MRTGAKFAIAGSVVIVLMLASMGIGAFIAMDADKDENGPKTPFPPAYSVHSDNRTLDRYIFDGERYEWLVQGSSRAYIVEYEMNLTWEDEDELEGEENSPYWNSPDSFQVDIWCDLETSKVRYETKAKGSNPHGETGALHISVDRTPLEHAVEFIWESLEGIRGDTRCIFNGDITLQCGDWEYFETEYTPIRPDTGNLVHAELAFTYYLFE